MQEIAICEAEDAGICVVHEHQFTGSAHRQRAEQDGIHDAENRRVDCNRERQHQQPHRRKSRVFQQRPNAIS